MKPNHTLNAILALALSAGLVDAGAQPLPQVPARAFRGPLLLSEPGDARGTAVEAVFVAASQGTNAGLRREVFLNLPGVTLADLTNHARFPTQPDAADTITAFETPSNSADDYGLRVSGFVVPPVNGSYKFYLSANGQAALFLGLDEHPEHKRVIAFEPVGNGPRQWTNGVNQASRGVPATNVSGAIQLVAGQAYYVEALMKAGTGDDNLAVAWQTPGAAAPANGAPPIAAPSLALTPPPSSLPTTGEAVPELRAFDFEVLSYMKRWNIKTTTLGVVKDGRLVLKRGYGWHDRARTQPVPPVARMRLASITKTITASAVKQFIGRGLISSNTPAFPYLGIQPYNGIWGDIRFTNIVIEHLLHHKAGWNRGVAGDPVGQFIEISTALGLDHPANKVEFISQVLTRPLQFAPGSTNAYSNIGYITLGLVVEKLTGQTLESVVRKQVFRPWGVKRIQPGRHSEKLREPDEPFYDDDTLTLDVQTFPSTDMVRAPDGGYGNWDAFEAVGAMIASVEDLLHHAQGFHLSFESIEEVALFGGNYVGPNYASIGEPRLTRKGTSSRHSGGWYGTTTFADQRPDGVDWAILQNSSSGNYDELLGIASRAISNIVVWPGDNSTRIELASDSFSVDENEGNLAIGVRRTGESTGVVSVAYSTMAGSALAGAEFTPVSGTLTFGSNEISRLITIPILDDTLAEPPKTFTLVLSDPTGGAGLGIAAAIITIEDDDNRQPPSISITSPASGALFPRGTNVAITAAPADSDGTIYTVKFFAGPTLIGEENKPPYTFVWPTPGPGTYSITARAIDNHGLMATSAPVVVTVGAGLAPASPGSILAEFWHRRPANTLTMLTSYANFPDAPTGFEYLDLFELSTNRADYYGTRMLGYVLPPATGNYTFWIASDDVAQLWLSSDEHPGNKLLIASNSFPVSPRNWAAAGSQRSAPVSLEAGRRYYVEALHKEATGTDHLAVGWQLPDGTLERPIPGTRLALFQPEAKLYADETVSVIEGDSGVTDLALNLRLLTSANGTFTVAFATANGSAIAGRDYVQTNGSVMFGPGQTNQTIRLGILGDRVDETNKTFVLRLSTAVDLALMSTPTRVTIMDDDPPPTVSLNDVAVREGDAGSSDAMFTASLSGPSELLVRVRFNTSNGTALAGSDYVATNVIVSFAPGTINQTIAVRILGDTVTEGSETFSGNLIAPVANAVIGRSQGLCTILDDEFRVSAVAFAGSDVRLTFTTEAGRTYRVEHTDSLAAPIVWESVPGADAIAGTAAIVEVLDSGGAGRAQRFYRVVLLAP